MPEDAATEVLPAHGDGPLQVALNRVTLQGPATTPLGVVVSWSSPEGRCLGVIAHTPPQPRDVPSQWKGERCELIGEWQRPSLPMARPWDPWDDPEPPQKPAPSPPRRVLRAVVRNSSQSVSELRETSQDWWSWMPAAFAPHQAFLIPVIGQGADQAWRPPHGTGARAARDSSLRGEVMSELRGTYEPGVACTRICLEPPFINPHGPVYPRLGATLLSESIPALQALAEVCGAQLLGREVGEQTWHPVHFHPGEEYEAYDNTEGHLCELKLGHGRLADWQPGQQVHLQFTLDFGAA